MIRQIISGKNLVGALTILLGLGVTESYGVNFRLFNNWGNQVSFEGGRTGFAFGDINGDGWLEFLSIGDHGSPNINANEHGIMTFFNRRRGQSWEVVMEGNFGYGMIAVGDINNDGEWDVGYAMHHDYNQGDLGNQMIEAALGNGSGRNWRPWDDGLAVPRQGDNWYGMFGVDLGDLDNDGVLDLGANSFGSGSGLHIYRNRGDGTWEDVYYFFGNNNSDMYFYFADFNNDGFLDVGAALHNRSLFLGDGNGGFEPAPTNGLPEQPFTGYLQGGSVGDIDRDGADDIVFCNANYGISVYRFNPEENRWESLSGALPQEAQYYFMTALADFDGDGWLDIIARGPQGIELWLQRPEQNERWVRDRVVGFQNYRGLNALHCADLDHNGRPDAVAMVNIADNLFNNRNYLYILFEDSEPEELSLIVDEPGGGEVFRMGSTRFIRWTSAIPEGEDAGSVDIHFSPNGQQGRWELVAQNVPNSGFAQWRIPRQRTQNGVLRLTLHLGDQEVVAYSRPFRILPSGGNVPILEVEPDQIDFGVVEVGEEVRRAVILRNSGNSSLSFDSIRVHLPYRWMMEMIDLEPGEETEGRVIFLTQQEGFFPDTLRIYSNGGNAYLPLLARTPNARGPMLLFRPDSLNFGRVHVDSSEERVSFLVNIGDRATTVNLSRQPDSPFHYLPWREELIEAGDSIPLVVVFTPPRARVYEGVARAVSPFSQAELRLRGLGFGQPMLIPAPDTLHFGKVLITRFREMVVQIVNVGDEEARLSIPQSRHSSFRWRVISDSTLSPQDTLLITVRFVPQQVGIARTELVVNYQVEALRVIVEGEGVTGPLLTADRDTVDFGEVIIRQQRVLPLVFRNRGNGPATVTIEPRRMGAFTWEGVDRVQVAPRDSFALMVTFSPWWDTLFSDRVVIAYENGILEIFLKGRGVHPEEVSLTDPTPNQIKILTLYPNPFNSFLSVEFLGDGSLSYQIELYTVGGQVVWRKDILPSHKSLIHFTLEAPELPAGVYILKINSAYNHLISKIVLLR